MEALVASIGVYGMVDLRKLIRSGELEELAKKNEENVDFSEEQTLLTTPFERKKAFIFLMKHLETMKKANKNVRSLVTDLYLPACDSFKTAGDDAEAFDDQKSKNEDWSSVAKCLEKDSYQVVVFDDANSEKEPVYAMAVDE